MISGIPDSTLSSVSPREFARGLDRETREYFHALVGRLQLADGQSAAALRTIGFTSCNRGEGVSTVAAQLAVAVAECSARRVLLADFNQSRPSVHRTFGIDRSPGLGDAIVDDGDLCSYVQRSGIENLWLLPIGGPADYHGAAFSAVSWNRVISSLSHEFDLVICDLPEAAPFGSAIPLASMLDGVVLVVEAERVRWEVAQRVKELLVRSGAPLLGVVMNKRRQYVPRWLYRTL